MVATDPKGRACMLGALEKQKMVYVFNRDSSARVTISSPLEAHKSNTLCFDLCAVDNGFDGSSLFLLVSEKSSKQRAGKH